MPWKCGSAEEAVSVIQSNHRVFIHGGVATPLRLVNALVSQAKRLRDVELIHLHTSGDAAYADPQYRDSFKVANLFVGGNVRRHMDSDRVDYLPCFLSEMPALFRSKKRPIHVALVQLSAPDRHGLCTLGTSVDVARAAVEVADVVIAQINANMPRVHGDGVVPLEAVDYYINVNDSIPEVPSRELTDVERKIGRNVAGLVEDGATLQMGIGAVPDAVLAELKSHKHLGIHSEMWSDGTLELIQCGAVDNSRKVTHPGRTVSGFVMGTRALYDFIDDNPSVIQLDIAYVNNVAVIARNPKVTAINSAVEIDLTGQVCADSVGHRIISGVGGQMDFMRGAAISEGGKPIIAITSRTGSGASRLVSELKPGAGVVTTRCNVHYVVTEHGVADLHGKTLWERAAALIAVAHPDDRERLDREWRQVASK